MSNVEKVLNARIKPNDYEYCSYHFRNRATIQEVKYSLLKLVKWFPSMKLKAKIAKAKSNAYWAILGQENLCVPF